MDRRTFLLLAGMTPVLAQDFLKQKQDLFLSNEDFDTLVSLNKRLRRLRRHVGFGNFNNISFDRARYFARNYSSIGKFTKEEVNLIEKLFYSDPKEFGFYGEKTTQSITNIISKKEIVKIPRSGHYVFKGKPHDDYKRIIKDVGSDLILTSGVRNVVKQLSLYSSKLISLKGNLTQTSSIIAPPAYTYHAIKDFDIGKKGWGSRNFTSEFAQTAEFAKIKNLNYIDIRYTINNKDGVRYEPWHVKVI